MKAIVYKTNTGSTKRYAEMLAKDTGLPAYELRQAFA
jgi:flavodoxin